MKIYKCNIEIDRNSFCLLNVIASISLNIFAYYIFYKCANICGLIINNGSASFFMFLCKNISLQFTVRFVKNRYIQLMTRHNTILHTPDVKHGRVKEN